MGFEYYKKCIKKVPQSVELRLYRNLKNRTILIVKFTVPNGFIKIFTLPKTII